MKACAKKPDIPEDFKDFLQAELDKLIPILKEGYKLNFPHYSKLGQGGGDPDSDSDSDSDIEDLGDVSDMDSDDEDESEVTWTDWIIDGAAVFSTVLLWIIIMSGSYIFIRQQTGMTPDQYFLGTLLEFAYDFVFENLAAAGVIPWCDPDPSHWMAVYESIGGNTSLGVVTTIGILGLAAAAGPAAGLVAGGKALLIANGTSAAAVGVGALKFMAWGAKDLHAAEVAKHAAICDSVERRNVQLLLLVMQSVGIPFLFSLRYDVSSLVWKSYYYNRKFLRIRLGGHGAQKERHEYDTLILLLQEYNRARLEGSIQQQQLLQRLLEMSANEWLNYRSEIRHIKGEAKKKLIKHIEGYVLKDKKKKKKGNKIKMEDFSDEEKMAIEALEKIRLENRIKKESPDPTEWHGGNDHSSDEEDGLPMLADRPKIKTEYKIKKESPDPIGGDGGDDHPPDPTEWHGGNDHSSDEEDGLPMLAHAPKIKSEYKKKSGSKKTKKRLKKKKKTKKKKTKKKNKKK